MWFAALASPPVGTMRLQQRTRAPQLAERTAEALADGEQVQWVGHDRQVARVIREAAGAVVAALPDARPYYFLPGDGEHIVLWTVGDETPTESVPSRVRRKTS